MKKHLLFLLFSLLLLNTAWAQYTSIPDKNFERKLIELGHDDVLDAQVKTEDIENLSSLYISNNPNTPDSLKIKDLTGIQDFKALRFLYCSNNELTSLDLSHNVALVELFCPNNELTSLDISHNVALEYLDCSDNELTSLDLSHNLALEDLDCSSNELSNLDLSHNVALENLSCSSNALTSLDLSHNVALRVLSCYSNALTSLDLSHNVALENLDCSSNELSNLDLSHNVALRVLSCSSNALTSLDLSHNVALENLSCSSNALTSLDLSHNVALRVLSCYSNALTSLDLSHNMALENLYCSSNALTSLDLSHNVALRVLSCYSNALTSLDLSHNMALENLYCSSNALTSLDVSHNVALENLYCSENNLTSLDLSVHTLLKNVNLTQNPLVCVKVSSEALASSANADENNWDEDVFTKYAVNCVPDNRYTSIPDPNFERELIQSGYDDVKDGKARTAFLETAKTLYLSHFGSDDSLKIKDLTGIQAFTNLEELRVSRNKLSVLDLSQNVALKILSCSDNNLTSLDLNHNVALKGLYCYSNDLTSLDVSHNVALEYLNCRSNNLTSLDLSDNGTLEELYCSSNALTSLDLSHNVALGYLNCSSNELTSLDISHNVALKDLSCSSNALTSLDLSHNVALGYLNCSSNALTSLDLSHNVALKDLYCSSNALTSLDLSHNVALRVLSCSSNALTSLDLSHNVALENLYCSSNELTSLDISHNVALKDLSCSSNALTSLDLSHNVALGYLNCSSNALTSLDLSHNLDLKQLFCSENKLTKLDLSKQTKLQRLEVIIENPLACIQLATQEMVDKANANEVVNGGSEEFKEPEGVGYSLNCDLEAYYSLSSESSAYGDVVFDKAKVMRGKSVNIQIVPKKGYDLSEFHINQSPKSTKFHRYRVENVQENIHATASYTTSDRYTLIPDLNFEKELIKLGYDDVEDGKVQTARIESIQRLDVNAYRKEDSEKIKSLVGIQDFRSLEFLNCNYHEIENLDLSQNIELKKILCWENHLESLILPKGDKLEYLDCEVNKLKVLDLSDKTNIETLWCNRNQLELLDISGTSKLKKLYVKENPKLNCIKVASQSIADFANSDDNQWSEDEHVSYSVACDYTFYTISYSQNLNGKISVSSEKVLAGDAVKLEVSPEENYRIKDVLVNGNSIGAVSTYSLVDIREDKVIQAIFEKKDENTTFKISYNTATNGSISVDKTEVKLGGSVIVSITADAGYRIKDVLVNGFSVGKVSSYTISNILENKSIEAIFEKAEGVAYYSLSVLPSKGGYIELDKSSNIEEGEDVKFSIESNEGYAIKDVLVNGKSVGISNTFTLTDIREDKIIQALFEEANEESIFNLTYETPSNGSISLDKSQVKFGEDATVTFVPESGYRVQDVFVNGASVGRVSTYTLSDIQEDKSIEVIFEKVNGTVYYQLTANISLHGNISLAKDSIEAGQGISFSVTANDGYKIQDVLINGKSIGAVKNYTLSDIQEDKSIEAIFEEVTGTIYYSLNAKPSASGSVLFPADKVVEGESVSFTVTANQGYRLQDVLVNGKSIGAITSYTLADVREDKTVEAIFLDESKVLSSLKSNKLHLSPNPVENLLKVRNSVKGSLIRVINLQGQVLKTKVSEGKLTTLDFSNLKEGVYFVLLEGEKAHKIVKK